MDEQVIESGMAVAVSDFVKRTPDSTYGHLYFGGFSSLDSSEVKADRFPDPGKLGPTLRAEPEPERPIPVIGNAQLRPGVTIVYGGPASGKSTLARHIALNATGHYLPWGEPGAPIGFWGNLARLRDHLSRFAATGEPMVVDSIKSLVYRSQGSSGARGISATLGEDLGVLNAQAEGSRTTLVLVVNPIYTEGEVFSVLEDAFRASVNSVVVVESVERVDGTPTEVRGRSTNRSDRGWQDFRAPLASVATATLAPSNNTFRVRF